MPDSPEPTADPELRLTALDDYPWHQSITPFPLPATSDTHFNDGYHFGFFSHGHFAFFGLRLYPNTNVMDGYAGVVVDGASSAWCVRPGRCVRTSRISGSGRCG